MEAVGEALLRIPVDVACLILGMAITATALAIKHLIARD